MFIRLLLIYLDAKTPPFGITALSFCFCKRYSEKPKPPDLNSQLPYHKF